MRSAMELLKAIKMPLVIEVAGVGRLEITVKTTIEDIDANPKALSGGKSAEEVAQMLREAGYDVTVQASKKSTSGAQIIKINNPGGVEILLRYKVSPGVGRHGANPYVKISASDQGIIKIVDGSENIYENRRCGDG